MNSTLIRGSDLLVLASRPLTISELLTPTRIACIAGALTALLLIWLGYSMLEKMRTWEQQRQTTNEGLFDQLCAAHKISRSERKLLEQLNAPLPRDQWGMVFVDPQVLMAQCRGGNQVGEHGSLGEKLFGSQFNE